MATDWNAIKADYLATGMRYDDLAAKWCVSISTLKKRAARENWTGRTIDVVSSTEPSELKELVELVDPAIVAAEARATRIKKLMDTTDAMMDRVIAALQVVEPDNTYALMTLVKSLKDLRDMQGLNKSALDLEEQKLRIELMRQQRQAQIAEPITVEFVNTDGAET